MSDYNYKADLMCAELNGRIDELKSINKALGTRFSDNRVVDEIINRNIATILAYERNIRMINDIRDNPVEEK